MRCEGGEKLDLVDIYILNLAITLGMFAVLIFRAWIEMKNYRMMWKELEWRETHQTMEDSSKQRKTYSQKWRAATNCIKCYAKSSK